MRFTQQQYEDYQARQRKNFPLPSDSEHHVTDELKLHDEIIAWCNRQHPRIKYIHARTDRKSTIGEGCQDFTLFLPGGKTICIEVKSRTGKFSNEQLAWEMEMKRLGHIIYCVRAWNDFANCVTPLLRLAERETPMRQEPEQP